MRCNNLFITLINLQSIEEWTENDVKLWMQACNIDIYHEVFASHRISGPQLKYLDSEKLQVLKFSMSIRKYIHMHLYVCVCIYIYR